MLWHIIFHCVTIYWLAPEYSTSEKYTMGMDKRETSCLMTYLEDWGGDDDQLILVSLVSNSKMVKVPSNNAVRAHKNSYFLIQPPQF